MQQDASRGIVSRWWHQSRPLIGRVALVLALYAVYLPLSGYQPADLRFDAGQYWELGLKFFQRGHFSLLNYDEPVRGYLGPLLLQPGRLLCHVLHWPGLYGARVLGAGWAALLIGVALPAVWEALTGRPLPAGRWLLLLGLTFIFWRDYFNFPLSDVPALTLLLLGLLALRRRGPGWALAAGLCLAGALNIRPIYLASLPGVLALLVLMRPRAGQLAALLLSVALVLLPQFLINQRHFQCPTPLVLAAPGPGSRPLYLRQLLWGTRIQRFETSLIPAYPRTLIFADTAGQLALAAPPGGPVQRYGQFMEFIGQQPVTFAGRCLRHLFNGLDSWFPTPYPRHLHPPGQAALRLLNYTLLAIGAALLLSATYRAARRRQLPRQPAAFLLAVLLPVAFTVPTAIEGRFLLPLHLLVLLGVAGLAAPRQWWQRSRPAWRLAVGTAWLAWVGGCWQLSEATARQLLPPGSEVVE
jgi:hypothetical protein